MRILGSKWQEHFPRIRELLDAGKSSKEIVEDLNVPGLNMETVRSQISRYRLREGTKPKPDVWSHAFPRFKELADAGHTYDEMVTLMGDEYPSLTRNKLSSVFRRNPQLRGDQKVPIKNLRGRNRTKAIDDGLLMISPETKRKRRSRANGGRVSSSLGVNFKKSEGSSPAPRPAPVTVTTGPAPGARNLKFVDDAFILSKMCRFAVSEYSAPPWDHIFCAADNPNLGPYCDHCRGKAYVPSAPRKSKPGNNFRRKAGR